MKDITVTVKDQEDAIYLSREIVLICNTLRKSNVDDVIKQTIENLLLLLRDNIETEGEAEQPDGGKP